MDTLDEQILSLFNTPKYMTTSDMKREINLANHNEAVKLLKQYHLAQPHDYIRSCGTSNFTDFSIDKLSQIANEDSKYIVARHINGKNIFLYHNSLLEQLEKFNYIESKGYFSSFKIKENGKVTRKIKGHFISDNELVVGNKSSEQIKIVLEEANIHTIVSRKYYYFDQQHPFIQSQIAALGTYLGYETKLARNDKNLTIKGYHLNRLSILKMPDLLISNLSSTESYDKIDFVDVVWAKHNHFSRAIAIAIELELSGNFDMAVARLISFNTASHYDETINLIISNHQKDYFIIKAKKEMDIYQYINKKFKLGHMTLQDFVSILSKRDKGYSKDMLYQDFIHHINFI